MFAGGGLPPEFADLLGGGFGMHGGGGRHFRMGDGMSFSFSSMGPGGTTFYSTNGGGRRRGGHPQEEIFEDHPFA